MAWSFERACVYRIFHSSKQSFTGNNKYFLYTLDHVHSHCSFYIDSLMKGDSRMYREENFKYQIVYLERQQICIYSQSSFNLSKMCFLPDKNI